jgi:hypothetical protein
MILSSRRRSGFALPAVLTVTGVVTLIFVVAITALSSLTSEAAASRARVRFAERALSIEAQLAFLATTEPFTARAIAIGSPRNFDDQFQAADGALASGLVPAEVLLDGTSYVADVNGPLRVQLRDQAGMINLPQLNDRQLAVLGERLSMDARLRDNLRSLLTDYSDTNDLELTGGAERRTYGDQRIANRPLLAPSEFLSVLGVRGSVSASAWRGMMSELAADQTQGTFNVNTASPDTLQVLYGLSADQAARAIRARETGPFLGLQDLGSATGAPLVDDGETLYTFPSGRLVYTLSDGRSAWVYRGRLSITPSHPEQPVWIDQLTITEAPQRAAADTTNATVFPYAIR